MEKEWQLHYLFVIVTKRHLSEFGELFWRTFCINAKAKSKCLMSYFESRAAISSTAVVRAKHVKDPLLSVRNMTRCPTVSSPDFCVERFVFWHQTTIAALKSGGFACEESFM
jgi:hypothetical protein